MIDIQDLKTLNDYIDFKKAEARPLTKKQIKHLEIAQKAIDIVRAKFRKNRANIISHQNHGDKEIQSSLDISNMRNFVEVLINWFAKNNKLKSDKITYQSLVQRIFFTAIFSQKNDHGTCVEYATNTALELLRKCPEHEFLIYQESTEIHSWIAIKGICDAKDIIVDSWSICPFPILREDFENHGFQKIYSVIVNPNKEITQTWLSEYDKLSKKIKEETTFNFSDRNELMRKYVLVSNKNSIELHRRKKPSAYQYSSSDFLLTDDFEINQYKSNESICAIRLRKLTDKQLMKDYELNALFSTERKKNHSNEHHHTIKYFTEKTAMLFNLKRCKTRLEILKQIKPKKHKKILESLEAFKKKINSKASLLKVI